MQGKTAARGYGGRWQRERLEYLKTNPLCVMCRRQGIVSGATVVDHIVPHKGNFGLMWDRSNWQALCETHHNRDKQRLDKGGHVTGCDVTGAPTDAAHHWNA